MMARRCIRPEDVAAVLELPATHPDRVHVATCPRCRTLVRSYSEFMHPASLPGDADVDGAMATLASRLSLTIGAPMGARAGETPAARGRTMSRALYAVAAVLAICAGLLVARDVVMRSGPRVPAGAPILRGEAAPDTPLSVEATDASGVWNLAWSRPAAADASEIVLYDAALGELARIPVAADTSTTLDLRLRPEAVDAAYARIVFLCGGDVCGRSATVPLIVR